MSVHEVVVEVPKHEVSRADVIFSVRKDGAAFGELRVSNGSLVWFAANKSYGSKMPWEDIDTLFEQWGTERAEKR